MFTFHPPTEDIDVLDSEQYYYGVPKDFTPTRYEPKMDDIIESFNLRYTDSNLYKEIPQVQEAFKNLGFNKAEDGSLTLLMDIMSRYVNIASAGEDYPNKLGSIGDIIDGHTDMLGGKSTEEAKNNEHPFFEKVAATLRDADELDNTQLIGWMRERDMVDTVDTINGKTILKGLSSYAQERFALPAAA